MLVLVVFSALLSGTEVAIFSLNNDDKLKLKEEKERRAEKTTNTSITMR